MDEKDIIEILQLHFRASSIRVVDDSIRHKSHKQSQGQGGHFTILIVSDDFDGMDLISRHRKIYDVLGMKDQKLIHALAISAWTEAEWKKKNQE